MIMEQDLNKIAHLYDTVAKEYSEAFTGEPKRSKR